MSDTTDPNHNQDARIVAINQLKNVIALVDEAEAQGGRDTLLALADDLEMLDPELAKMFREAAK